MNKRARTKPLTKEEIWESTCLGHNGPIGPIYFIPGENPLLVDQMGLPVPPWQLEDILKSILGYTHNTPEQFHEIFNDFLSDNKEMRDNLYPGWWTVGMEDAISNMEVRLIQEGAFRSLRLVSEYEEAQEYEE